MAPALTEWEPEPIQRASISSSGLRALLTRLTRGLPNRMEPPTCRRAVEAFHARV